MCGLVGTDGSLLLGSDSDGFLVYVLDLLSGRGVELQDPGRVSRRIIVRKPPQDQLQNEPDRCTHF